MQKKSCKKSQQGGNSKVEHFWKTLESGTWLPCLIHKNQSKCYGKEKNVKPVEEIESLGESVSKAVAKPIEEVAKPIEEVAKPIESAIGGRKKRTKKHMKKRTKKHMKKRTKKHMKKRNN